VPEEHDEDQEGDRPHHHPDDDHGNLVMVLRLIGHDSTLRRWSTISGC
jgi:hypothetical protein